MVMLDETNTCAVNGREGSKPSINRFDSCKGRYIRNLYVDKAYQILQLVREPEADDAFTELSGHNEDESQLLLANGTLNKCLDEIIDILKDCPKSILDVERTELGTGCPNCSATIERLNKRIVELEDERDHYKRLFDNGQKDMEHRGPELFVCERRPSTVEYESASEALAVRPATALTLSPPTNAIVQPQLVAVPTPEVQPATAVVLAEPTLALPSRKQVITNLVKLSDDVLDEDDEPTKRLYKAWNQVLRVLASIVNGSNPVTVNRRSSSEEITDYIGKLSQSAAELEAVRSAITWPEAPSPQIDLLLSRLLELESQVRPRSYLVEEAANLIEAAKSQVADLLAMFGLTCFEDSGTFDGIRHNAVDTEPTDNPERDMQICATVSAGLMRGDSVVRAQSVIVYKYKQT